jgi:hypothetical protein
LDACEVINVKRPDKCLYVEMVKQQPKTRKYNKESATVEDEFVNKISKKTETTVDKTCEVIDSMNLNTVLNIKELNYFDKVETIPDDIFNTVCDAVIAQMIAPDKLVHATFRDALYDILIYNLDAVECIWYIFSHFVENDLLKGQDISDVLTRMHYIIVKTNGYDELPKSL